MKIFNTSYVRADVTRRARHGEKWTPEEYSKLKTAFTRGATLKDMVELLERPATGVLSKLSSLGYVEREVNSDQYHYAIDEEGSPPQIERERLYRDYHLVFQNDQVLYKKLKQDSACGWNHLRLSISSIARMERSRWNYPVLTSGDLDYLACLAWIEIADGDETDAIYLKQLSKFLPDQSATATPAPVNPTESTIMTASQVPFQTISYVYGSNVANMTTDQLIDAIKKAETDINYLKSVTTKSKKIDQMVADGEAMLAKIVEALDSK